MGTPVEKYLQSWQSKLNAALLDYVILVQAALNPKDVHPYSIHQYITEQWGDNVPHLQTVYSAINRLEKGEFVKIFKGIVDGRVQKRILTTETGFDLMEQMGIFLKRRTNAIMELQPEEMKDGVKKGDTND